MHVRFIFSEKFEYTSKPRVNSFHAARYTEYFYIE